MTQLTHLILVPDLIVVTCFIGWIIVGLLTMVACSGNDGKGLP